MLGINLNCYTYYVSYLNPNASYITIRTCPHLRRRLTQGHRERGYIGNLKWSWGELVLVLNEINFTHTVTRQERWAYPLMSVHESDNRGIRRCGPSMAALKIILPSPPLKSCFKSPAMCEYLHKYKWNVCNDWINCNINTYVAPVLYLGDTYVAYVVPVSYICYD